MNTFARGHVSIRTILITVFLLLMIVPMAVITAVTYLKQNEVYKQQVSQFVSQTVQQAHRALDANLAEIDRLMWPILYREKPDFLNHSLDDTYSLIQASTQFQTEMFLNYFRGRINQIKSVYFVTPDHKLIATDNAFLKFEQIDQANFATIAADLERHPLKIRWFSEDKALINTSEQYETSIHSSVIAARRILDSNRAELQGYLLIHFNTLFLRDVLQNVKIGRTGSLFIVDSADSIIYSQDASILGNKDIMSAVRAQSAGNGASLTSDGKWMIAADTSDISGWRMIAAVPMNELLEPNRAIVRNLLLIAGLGAVVSIFVSVALATAVSRPVVRLSHLMMKASHGNLDVRDRRGTFKEINILQRNFNNLMERIEHLIAENEREQREKREAHLRALQTQIHPHFLYNTLDTIYWMAKKAKADAIARLVAALGRFFRLSLNAGQEWTTLEQEFDHVRNYLEIQSIRYRDKVTYEIRLEDPIRCAFVIPLLLQPIVENALEHGITQSPARANADSAGTKAIVTIEGRLEEELVVIRIADSGKGMDEETLRRLQLSLRDPAPSDHIGLRNVQQRIMMTYGGEYGVSLESALHQGTCVTIRIPFRKEAAT